ncbi:hypothetical protein M011DRAFT_488799 [Sporormia fimetaria CBS 119925]|uniref:Protein kinase domain-containing protein n=1 Tax=Sporormia fimetaria CBS 119925 TaxID=1340428 RepID=A0A6A6V2D9_9PLEO|nr:hypothetical protein M011DRAFT_488799 [Sporormia fimetaria CBS 119925]
MTQNFSIDWHTSAYLTSSTLTLVIFRGYTSFNIKASLSELKNTPLLARFHALPDPKPRRYSPEESITQVLYQLCLPTLEKFAPQMSLPNLNIEAFLRCPVYHLELVCSAHGRNDENNRIGFQGEDDCSYAPAFAMAPMWAADLPEDLDCSLLPRFHARHVRVAPMLAEGQSLSSSQGKVLTADGIQMYFKPRIDMREPEFLRELRILTKLRQLGLNRLRVSRLQGLVVSGDSKEIVVGMLLNLIPSPAMGTHLKSPGIQAMVGMPEKWERQVTETVEELHEHDLVWGDVNPMNVVIDEALDAWVIDFGGMNNVEFVDDAKRETVEGDWQGIRRLFREWLPSQVNKSSESVHRS